MTLIGKIFRPWDLPCEESHLQINGSNPSTAQSESERKSCVGQLKSEHGVKEVGEIKRESEKSASSEIPPTRSQNLSSHFPSHEMLMMMSNYEETSILSPTVPNCCEPISPSEFDLHLTSSCSTGSPSSIFLYPNAINELASLSRNELTAMGLLPPGLPSSHKVKRQRPKRFHCPHCQVAFSNNGQLRGHIRIHTGKLCSRDIFGFHII